ncbi:DUF4197 domain-containing protein [Thermodesulfobacteriota bacterium]
MKFRDMCIAVIVMVLLIVPASQVHAGFGDVFKSIQKMIETGGGLSESEIVNGLKEALEIGTDNAVKIVSSVNGYYGNPEIRIPLPEPVRKMEKALRGVGFGSQVDAFELSMNRAAEQAAPEAGALFLETIKQMSFADARNILEGEDNAATLYFKEKTEIQLGQTFKPIVHSTMSEVGVTRIYQDLNTKVQSIPFAGNLDMDLDQYVTDRALDGLFLMLAEEERKIREDPAARVTDLLKKVFNDKR